MKKIIKYTLGMMAVILLFAACEKNEPILFQNEDAFVSFVRGSGSVSEARMVDGEPVESVLAIPVMLVTLDNNPVTVDFEFSTEGIANPAVEGDAFVLLNDEKRLSFSGGMSYDTIYIRTIDDDIFTGNRSVDIVLGSNSAGYNTGTQNTFRMTIIDDEHPLNIVLGSYQVTGLDIWDGAINQVIETSAVEGSLDMVSFPLAQFIPGWGVPASALVFAMVDVEEQTFQIQVGQDYDSFGYGPSKIRGDDGETGTRLEDGLFIKGTFDDDGNITIHDRIGVIITDGGNAGLHFTIWQAGSVWTKQAKGFVAPEPVQNEDRELRSN